LFNEGDTHQSSTDKPVALKFPNLEMLVFSAPSCDHFGHHGEWKKYLATKILAKVANWRPTDLNRNLLEKLSKRGRI